MAISVEGLSAAVKGRVVERGDPEYDSARALYNANPAAIAYCVDEADVVAATKYATGRDLRIAVRCGGHNGGGLGSVDDGLVIDLSEMSAVAVDASARMARVRAARPSTASSTRRTITASRFRSASSAQRVSAV